MTTTRLGAAGFAGKAELGYLYIVCFVVPGENTSKAAQRLTKAHVPRPGLTFMTISLKDNTPPLTVREEFHQARRRLGDEARNLPVGAIGPFVRRLLAESLIRTS